MDKRGMIHNVHLTFVLCTVIIITEAGLWFPSGNAILSSMSEPSTADSSSDLLWNATWDGPKDDTGQGIAVDAAGNTFTTGWVASWAVGTWDVWLAKYSDSGSLLWNRTWDGSQQDRGYNVALDSAGYVYVCGWTQQTGISYQVLIIKFDSSGDEIWNATWGGPGQDEGSDIVLDVEGNIYVCGDTSSWLPGPANVWVGKFSGATGSLMWNNTWGDLNTGDIGTGIALDQAGHVFVTGYTYSYHTFASGWNIWLGKFDCASGQLLGNATVEASYDDYARDIVVDQLGNVYVTGLVEDASGDSDGWLGKYNYAGVLQWSRTVGGDAYDDCSSILVDREGYIYISGRTESWTGSSDGWFSKYDSTGARISTVSWGIIGYQTFNGIALGCDGSARLVGSSDAWSAFGSIIVLRWDLHALPCSESWWGAVFLGLPVWGWLVVLAEAAIILLMLVSGRKKPNRAPNERKIK